MDTLKRRPAALAFAIFFVVMAVYSLWRMFAITPWYDETVTYMDYIDRGSWYCMTNWPQPTNHVFYCLLSSLLNLTGNAWIGLRGVSYLASLANLALLFLLLKKFGRRGTLREETAERAAENTALIGVILYAGCRNVMDLSVQGRGYTLSNTFFLLCLICVAEIFSEDRVAGIKRKWFLGYGLGMFLALYTVPTNIYWIVSFCLSLLIWCLIIRKRIYLVRFIGYGLMGAALTVVSYGLIWFSTGMRLLNPKKDSSPIQWILQLPEILWTGLSDMLSNDVIQPVGRDAAFRRMGQWLLGMAEEFSGPGRVSLAAFLVLAAVCLFFFVIRIVQMVGDHENEENPGGKFLLLFSGVALLLVPIMLLVQGTLPYYRCFLWTSVPLVFLSACMLNGIVRRLHARESIGKGVPARGGWYGLLCVILVVFLYLWGRESYEQQPNEDEIRQILDQTTEPVEHVILGDDRVRYYVYFSRGTLYKEDDETPDHIIVKKAAMDPGYEGYWDDYYLYGDLPWNYIKDNMELYYQTGEYVAFREKE